MRPIIHYRPEKNWINDPNGLCQAEGWYHLFYQYNPNDSVWGDMHWGHARSRDMYRWEDMPVALFPDTGSGEIHCFSGSCCKDREGKPRFFYTSIGRAEDGRDCTDGARQRFALPADGAMTRLVQTEGEIRDEIHGGLHVRDWRDPCVIRYGDGYLMVLGGSLEGKGCILLYSSQDMAHWTYRHVLLRAAEADGVPWECPNLFMLDGKAVLFWSPCGVVQYAVGTLDASLELRVERTGVLDPGERQGYYAPQAFCDEQGRTILMGWMPECDGDDAARRRGWSGVMSLPRLLSVRAGDLDARPLPGWEKLCGEGMRVEDGACIRAGQHYILCIRTKKSSGSLRIVCLASEEANEETLLMLEADGRMTMARDRSSLSGEPVTTPICRMAPLQEENEVFLCVDGTAVEWMVNGKWLSGRVYPTRADAVYLRVDGAEKAMLYPIG